MRLDQQPLSPEEELARAEVLKIEPRTWHLAQDENGRLLVLNAIGTVILHAENWSGLLALITVHPDL